MDSNSLNATEIAVGRLLAGGVGGINGGGAWTNSAGGVQYAGMNTIQHGLECNRDIVQTGIENIERSIADGRQADLIVNGQAKICDNINVTGQRITDNQFRAELRGSDQHAAIVAQMNAAAAAQAKCCCDQLLETAKMEARLTARMESLSKEGITRDLDRAERKVERLELQNACGCGCEGRHHGRP